MNFDNIEITKREILIGVLIVFIMLGFGFIIATKIHDSVTQNNEKYFKALKIDNNPELLEHAIETDVGNVLSFGTVTANEPVSDKLIDGEYFSITKIEEHYVQKTRVVTYTDSEGNIKTRTETYWEWDEVERENFSTETFNFLGKTFNKGDIKFSNSKHIDTVKIDTSWFKNDIRYKFYGIPKEFNGSLFFSANGNEIQKPKFHHNKSIKQIIDNKEKEADRSIMFFWTVWILLTILAVFIFAALENRFLNGRKS